MAGLATFVQMVNAGLIKIENGKVVIYYERDVIVTGYVTDQHGRTWRACKPAI